MDKQDWAQERWETKEDGSIECSYGSILHRKNIVVNDKIEVSEDDWAYEPSNSPRIIACVNACAGIPTEKLKAVADGKADIEIAGNSYADMTDDEAKRWIEHPLTQLRIKQAIGFVEDFDERQA